MIARPKISRNERKTTEIGAFEVGNFALFPAQALLVTYLVVPTVTTHLSLLYGPYEGEFWYWEIVELLRRVAATSVVMVVSDGDVHRERAALEFLAEEAKQQMKEYGVDLTGARTDARKKQATKRESVSEVAEAVGAAFAALFGDAPDEHSAADDDDNRSWDSRRTATTSARAAGDIDALARPCPLRAHLR
ncbi:hypothetical protein SO694_000263114 [Aureococcus anophagefferens]|uniref:Uncharacterized protein n=1 Tax=Aureococcus anophagefferens TaxID=44056 RepID=A0ABR1FUQ7_AURAN